MTPSEYEFSRQSIKITDADLEPQISNSVVILAGTAFSPGPPLTYVCWVKVKTQEKRKKTEENRTSPFCTLVVARLHSPLNIFGGRFLAERIFRGFMFSSRRICHQSSCRRICFSSFLWENAQKNPPGKPRQNPPEFLRQKSPTHFCRGASYFKYLRSTP